MIVMLLCYGYATQKNKNGKKKFVNLKKKGIMDGRVSGRNWKIA